MSEGRYVCFIPFENIYFIISENRRTQYTAITCHIYLYCCHHRYTCYYQRGLYYNLLQNTPKKLHNLLVLSLCISGCFFRIISDVVYCWVTSREYPNGRHRMSPSDVCRIVRTCEQLQSNSSDLLGTKCCCES